MTKNYERWEMYCEAKALEMEALALAHQMARLAVRNDDMAQDAEGTDEHHKKLTADYMRRAANWRAMKGTANTEAA